MAMNKYLLSGLLLLIFALLVWTLWGNSALTVTHYRTQSQKLPAPFYGFTIAQVSDLHNTRFGKDNRKLLDALENAKPQLIAIIGDLVDSRRTDPEVAVAFAREAVRIAPVYYVPGNHESRIPEIYGPLKDALADLGVVILENKQARIEKDGQTIGLIGLTDPNFGIAWPAFSTDGYQVVLSHRPERFAQYADRGYDLVLTGHAHGGQIRLPWLGGLFAPHQGLLPEYDAGMHTQQNTTMVVSRGLGNSAFPLRFNNRPEVVVITLESL